MAADLREDLQKGRPVFYLHLPKTAGSSVRLYLTQRFPVQQTHNISQGGGAERANPKLLCGKQLAAGHVCYSFIRQFPQTPIALAFLREPVDRAISQYNYFQEIGPVPLSGWPGCARIRELTFDQFLHAEPKTAHVLFANLQTWMLSQDAMYFNEGDRLKAPPTSLEFAPDALEIAKANLARCDLIGLFERMPESMQLLSHSLGWPMPETLPHKNKTRSRPKRDQLESETQRLLEEMSDLDRQLHAYACDLFEQRLASSPPTGDGNRTEIPPAGEWTFDRAIPGFGWSFREQVAQGWSCWLEREGWLEFRVQKHGAMRLQCVVSNYVHARQLEQLSICANDTALSLTRQPIANGILLEAIVPQACFQQANSVVRLTFRVPELLRPCDVIPGSIDERPLGIALSKVHLEPLSWVRRIPFLRRVGRLLRRTG